VERIDVTGPTVLLPPATAQSIALALHELVTNAAKYGALSVDSGRVKVMWQMQPGCLNLSWVESDGPEITRPSRHGYGMRVITAGIEGQLGGVVQFEWMPAGMHCSMSVPYDKDGAIVWRPDSASLNDAGATSDVSKVKPGNAVLLVEDEPLISMMLEELLIAFGHGVDGPYNKMSDAMLAAANRDLHAGILDINVGGEKIYALAEVLAKRKIPFVFVTGYSPGAVDARFSHVPVLQKPIEPQKLRSILLSAARQ
jgi:CheY-like chemotaxis protein